MNSRAQKPAKKARPWYKGHTDTESSSSEPEKANRWERNPTPYSVQERRWVDAPGWIGFQLTSAGKIEAPEESEDGKKPDEAAVPRGRIDGLSRKSAARLSKELGSSILLHGGPPVSSGHVTLTLPGDFPKDQRILQRWWKSWAERVRAAGLCGMWRLEFQKRGAPHWHVLLYDSEDRFQHSELWEAQLEKLRGTWSDLTGNEGRQGFHVGRADGRAGFYLACHAAKRSQGVWPAWWKGRAWGHINRPQWEAWKSVTVGEMVSRAEEIVGRRLAERFINSRRRLAGLPRRRLRSKQWTLFCVGWTQHQFRKAVHDAAQAYTKKRLTSGFAGNNKSDAPDLPQNPLPGTDPDNPDYQGSPCKQLRDARLPGERQAGGSP